VLITVLQVLLSGLLLGGIYALISIGLTIIFGVIQIVNFAHGEFLMLAMYFTYWIFTLWGLDPYVAALLVTPLLFGVGVLTQRMIIQPILNARDEMQIFATVGLSIALQNLALFLWKADFRSVKTSYQTAVWLLGPLSISVPRFVAFVIAVAATVGLFYFFKCTYTGKALRAIAQNREASLLMGINVKQMYVIAFGIGAAAVGLGGALLSPIYYVFPTVGVYFSLTAFVVVVLGGLGDMVGAFFGGLIIGLVEALSGFLIGASLKEAVYFVIFILILLLRPQGLFGLGRKTGGVAAR
jgi:branched-chain amino acid transport system permease protein